MDTYYYTFPSAFDTSSPDSISPPASVSAPSPDYVFMNDVPSPGYSSEFEMLHSHSHGMQRAHMHANTHAQYLSSSVQQYDAPHSAASTSSPVTDFDFMNSLRSIRGTRSKSFDQTDGDHEPDGPTESEAIVAETIVRARKSWKTVKGRSEPVWPPHLEKALVQALLQYKPHDSRYARALGRFPKRNRYISDYIFETTGVRRTPKQVGSRLQQLKDVSCGKLLLNHVASWSLEATSTSSSGASDTTVSPSKLHPNLNVIINDVHMHGSEGLHSPVSPLSSGGAGARDASGAVMKARHSQSALYPAGRLHTGSSAPVSPFCSPPLTPVIRKLDVFIPFDPSGNSEGRGNGEDGRARSTPLVRFGGCLAQHETVFAIESADLGKASGWLDPRATFSARDPIAAQSVTHVYVDNMSPSSSGPSLSPTNILGREHYRKGTRVRIYEHHEPLVCSQTPAARASAAQTSFYPADTIAPSKGDKDRDCFVYATRLVDDATWRRMRREGAGLMKYTITQKLMYSFDSPGTTRGETFLIITYHFAPTSTLLSPLDTRGFNSYLNSYGRGSVSPSSSGTPSPVSASPSSFVHPMNLQSRQGECLDEQKHDAYRMHNVQAPFQYQQVQTRMPLISGQAPAPTVSHTGALLNVFGQQGCYDNIANPGAFSGYDVDFNTLNIDGLHLNTSANANLGFDHSHTFR